MAQLGGRTMLTRIASLEVLSDDGKTVLMVDRNEDGTLKIRTRLPWESSWSSNGLTFNVDKDDGYLLGMLLKGEDVTSWGFRTEKVTTKDFTADKPQSVIDEELGTKAGDCTELDIERAKASRIAEEKDLLKLQNSRDHALDKHIGQTVDGCYECEIRTRPGYGDGSLPQNPEQDFIRSTHIEEEATDASDDAPADNTEVPW